MAQLAVHTGIATLIILVLLHSALALVLIPRFVDRSDLRSLHHASLSAAKPDYSLEVAFENGHFRTSLELQHFHPLTPVGETVRRERRWTPVGTPARELVRSTRCQIEVGCFSATKSTVF